MSSRVLHRAGPAAKAVVVLGKKLLADGSASAILMNRVGFACDVFRKNCGPNDVVILTGGKVGCGMRSEAEVMRDLILGNEAGDHAVVHFGEDGGKTVCDFKGVREHQVVVEDTARTTIENAFLIRELLEERGISEVLLVTDDFHMARSAYVFRTVMACKLGSMEVQGLQRVLQPAIHGRPLKLQQRVAFPCQVLEHAVHAPLPAKTRQAELDFEARFSQEKLLKLMLQVLQGIPEKLGDNKVVHEPACAEFESDVDLLSTAPSLSDNFPPFPQSMIDAEFAGGMAQWQANFEELELLGQGQFGKVFAARSRNSGAMFAVKRLPIGPKAEHEVELLAKLSHENVVRLEAVFKTDTELLIVTELCEKGALPKQLRHLSPGSGVDCLQVMYELSSALWHCHSLGYAHCDVKADNIMFTSSPNAEDQLPSLKLIDFGNAQSVGTDSANLLAKDVWFAGLIFYKLITRQDFFIQDDDELRNLDEQGVYVDPYAMQCGGDYLRMQMEKAARCCGSEGADALDLLRQMLELNVTRRITAGGVLEHPAMAAFSLRCRMDTDSTCSTATVESGGYPLECN